MSNFIEEYNRQIIDNNLGFSGNSVLGEKGLNAFHPKLTLLIGCTSIERKIV